MLKLVVSVLLLLCQFTASDLSFCRRKEYYELETSYSENNDTYCPGGLIFKFPHFLTSIKSDEDGFCYKDSICPETHEKWHCGVNATYLYAQIIIAGPAPIDEDWVEQEPIKEGELTYDVDDCEFDYDLLMSSTAHQRPEGRRNKRQSGTAPIDETAEGSENVALELLDQTKRMFYFLANPNKENVYSNLRVVSLFEKSVQIVRSKCDHRFLAADFLNKVKEGLLFLLKEQGTEQILDVDTDSYALLMKALEICHAAPSIVQLEGRNSPEWMDITGVSRDTSDDILSMSYAKDRDSYPWGKYDVIVDAAWNIVDMVHGICFATFRQNNNLHHQYQIAMEELFDHSISLRWTRSSITLAGDNMYNNIFMAPIKESMNTLNACVQGSYIGSPFFHRLRRPIQEEHSSRKKRFVPPNSNVSSIFVELPPDEVLCLQTDQERKDHLVELRKKYCRKSYIDRYTKSGAY